MSYILDALTREQREKRASAPPDAAALLAAHAARSRSRWMGLVVSALLGFGVAGGAAWWFTGGMRGAQTVVAEPPPANHGMKTEVTPVTTPPLAPVAVPAPVAAPEVPEVPVAAPVAAAPLAALEVPLASVAVPAPVAAPEIPEVPAAVAAPEIPEVPAAVPAPVAVPEVPVVAPAPVVEQVAGYRVRVVGVFSGCEVEVERAAARVRVRLAGLLCPAPETPDGRAARGLTTRRAFVQEVTLSGLTRLPAGESEVELVLPEGESLNRLLVIQGLARAEGERFLPEEREARARQVGMWRELVDDPR